MLRNTKRNGQVFNRFVLPLILFVAIIGGLAWVVQYMPSGGAKTTPPSTEKSEDAGPLLQLDEQFAFWDPEDKNYVKEFERTGNGHYDFNFTNVSNNDIQLWLAFVSCTCGDVEVCVLDAEHLKERQKSGDKPAPLPDKVFKKLEREEAKSVVIPKNGGGIVRLVWDNKRQTSARKDLIFEILAQPVGKPALRQKARLGVPVRMVDTIQFFPSTLNLGPVSKTGAGTLFLWSSTREELDVKATGDDPRFDYKLTRLSDEELDGLKEKLKKSEINSRPKVGYRLDVKVYEEKKGKWLDQGHLIHAIPLSVDGTTIEGPALTAFVRGDVIVGNASDDGKIHFKSFRSADGIEMTVPVRTDPKMKLTMDSKSPGYIEVDLNLNKKESNTARSVWMLKVRVPANTVFGPLPENSAIMLRTQAEDQEPRLIRVPVTGLGTQG